MEKFSRDILDYPDGIVLPIDKPYRWTSADVIRKVKYAAIRHFGKKNLKVGHAGTLDPLATGILLVCIGPATRRAEELQRSAKQYVAGISFGATTPSYDLEKDIDCVYPQDGVSEESIRAALLAFVGEQQQVAPLFSAKSVDGVRVYEKARKLLREAQREGRPFDYSAVSDILQSSTICIYDLELLRFEESIPVQQSHEEASCLRKPESSAPDTVGKREPRINVADVSDYNLKTATIRIDCSKGTYIRAFARDLGESLGSGAFLSSLRRTRNGGYDISEALSLDQVMQMLSSD